MNRSNIYGICRLSSRFSQQFTKHECDCTIFLYLLDQGSRLLKLILYTSRDNKASFEKKFVEDYSKCKVIKSPSQFSTCWTYTKERETIKKCKLQTQILFQMKNWTRWKITFVKYCFFRLLTYFFFSIIPFWYNNLYVLGEWYILRRHQITLMN